MLTLCQRCLVICYFPLPMIIRLCSSKLLRSQLVLGVLRWPQCAVLLGYGSDLLSDTHWCVVTVHGAYAVDGPQSDPGLVQTPIELTPVVVSINQ